MKKSFLYGILYFCGACILIAVFVVMVIFFSRYIGGMLNSGETETTTAQKPTFPPPVSVDNKNTEQTPEPTADPLDIVVPEGQFELPVSGSTGFAAVIIYMRSSPDNSSKSVKALSAGESFRIISESGDWWEIENGGFIGWVQHAYCMINLPDVVPSIIYNITNSYSSLFISSGEYIPNVTGEQLYSCREYNPRLERDEYLVPVMYSMAPKICAAQQAAVREGNSLIIYEAYRPRSTQSLVVDELTKLSETNAAVKRGISSSPWSMSWFIATGTSNHQKGCAIDVSLVEIIKKEYTEIGGYRIRIISNYLQYTMPSPIHELSTRAITFTAPVTINSYTAWESAELSEGMAMSEQALNLQRYCTGAGLTPLASEWWHFNDLYTVNSLKAQSTGDFEVSGCMSTPPSKK